MKHLYITESKINGHGLHTNRPLKKGERVGIIKGEVEIVRKFDSDLAKASLNWIGIGRYSWLNTKDSPFRYINHSCEPNTYIRGKRLVYAMTNVKAGEELTMDYSITEADPDWSIDACACGSLHCRKVIGPIQNLKPRIFQKLKPLINQPFLKIYHSSRSTKGTGKVSQSQRSGI